MVPSNVCGLCCADTSLCSDLAWGEVLPTPGKANTKSLHWTGSENVTAGGADALTLNHHRGVFMYIFMGGWYKGFGIPGDTLPTLAESLFGKGLASLLVDDEHGQVVSCLYDAFRLKPFLCCSSHTSCKNNFTKFRFAW